MVQYRQSLTGMANDMKIYPQGTGADRCFVTEMKLDPTTAQCKRYSRFQVCHLYHSQSVKVRNLVLASTVINVHAMHSLWLRDQIWVLNFCITVTSLWARWRLKSPASPLFTQPFIQVQIKENIKAPRHWPLCGEFIGDRWIPRANGQ